MNHSPCQYIRGQGYGWLRYRSDGAQIVCRGLASPLISNELERDLVPH